MWKAIYELASGRLVSIGTVVADPLPSGLGVVEVGDERPTGIWNTGTLVFDPAPVEPRVWATNDFMARFTLAEETAIRARAMTDAGMQTFLARMERARSVTENHPDLVNGLAYCVSTGCITSERAEVIHHG